MTIKSIYQKPVAVVLNIDCAEVLCSSVFDSSVEDVSLSEGWEWDVE